MEGRQRSGICFDGTSSLYFLYFQVIIVVGLVIRLPPVFSSKEKKRMQRIDTLYLFIMVVPYHGLDWHIQW